LIYNTGTVNQRLKAIEKTLNNGLGRTVQEHGERIVALETKREVM